MFKIKINALLIVAHEYKELEISTEAVVNVKCVKENFLDAMRDQDNFSRLLCLLNVTEIHHLVYREFTTCL